MHTEQMKRLLEETLYKYKEFAFAHWIFAFSSMEYSTILPKSEMLIYSGIC